MGQVIPGTLKTTVCRFAALAAEDPDSGAPDPPESVLLEQPATSIMASKRPRKRFILTILSIDEKNGCGCVTNTKILAGIEQPVTG